MKTFFSFFCLAASVASATCTDFPSTGDLRRLEYGVEKLASSSRVVVEFPQLSKHKSCASREVPFGTLWEVELAPSEPIAVSVLDLNGTKVQAFGIYGPVDLKATSTRLQLRFYSAKTDKRIDDHRLSAVEISSTMPIVPPPTVEVDDAGARRTLPAKIETWP